MDLSLQSLAKAGEVARASGRTVPEAESGALGLCYSDSTPVIGTRGWVNQHQLQKESRDVRERSK